MYHLRSSAFENFIFADNSFAKAFQIFGTCVLVNHNLCGKLASSLKLELVFDYFLSQLF